MGRHILLVSENRESGRREAVRLEGEGFRVSLVRDAAEAIARVIQGHGDFDSIIVDSGSRGRMATVGTFIHDYGRVWAAMELSSALVELRDHSGNVSIANRRFMSLAADAEGLALRFRERDLAALAGGRMTDMEEFASLPEGGWEACLSTRLPVRDLGGKAFCVLCLSWSLRSTLPASAAVPAESA